MLYGTAEAVPYKDSAVATQVLQPVGFLTSKVVGVYPERLAPAKTDRLKPVPLGLFAIPHNPFPRLERYLAT
jgi:hypothetical protein